MSYGKSRIAVTIVAALALMLIGGILALTLFGGHKTAEQTDANEALAQLQQQTSNATSQEPVIDGDTLVPVDLSTTTTTIGTDKPDDDELLTSDLAKRKLEVLPEGTRLTTDPSKVQIFDLYTGERLPGTKYNPHKGCFGVQETLRKDEYVVTWSEIYTVQPGDTLSQIIIDCGWAPAGVNVYDYLLACENGTAEYKLFYGDDPDNLQVGQNIIWTKHAVVVNNYVGTDYLSADYASKHIIYTVTGGR